PRDARCFRRGSSAGAESPSAAGGRDVRRGRYATVGDRSVASCGRCRGENGGLLQNGKLRAGLPRAGDRERRGAAVGPRGYCGWNTCSKPRLQGVVERVAGTRVGGRSGDGVGTDSGGTFCRGGGTD